MYTEKDLVAIAKRDGNKKRNYLVVNRLQGKHVPASPKAAFCLFSELAGRVRKAHEGERLLVIGFAETATAIGSAVAIELGAMYIQTTREDLPGAEYLFFSEEHSHATAQKLVKDELDRIMGEVERIIFVEDELTTGKTIVNLIRVLEESYGEGTAFSVASLLNGMDEEAMSLYRRKNIELHYVVKTKHQEYTQIAEQFSSDGEYIPCSIQSSRVEELTLKGGMNPRRLVDSKQYNKACERLWEQLEKRLKEKQFKRVLLLGTEECMYPSLFAGYRLEQQGVQVFCHSTTRSPIAVSRDAGYPFRTRYELRSLYDVERITYLYDLTACDLVIIITDAAPFSMEGAYSLINAVGLKNENILMVRWCLDENFL